MPRKYLSSTMKEHFCRSVLKMSVRACVLSVAFCGASEFLSSCGGGGAASASEESVTCKLLEGRYMTLRGPEEVLVRIVEQTSPRSMVYDCDVIWGAKSKVCSGMMTLTPGSALIDNAGKVKALAFTMVFSDSDVADSDEFKKFWGISSSDTGGAVRGMKGEVSELDVHGSLTQGRFKVVPTYSGKDGTDASLPVIGDVYIDDTPYAGN